MSAADTTIRSWSYSASVNRFVSSTDSPFTLKGGNPTVDADGAEAVRFSTAPSLATYSTSGFPTPGRQDFAWTVVMSMERLVPRSTANVAQYGRWNGHQLKVQLDTHGVPDCFFNGSNGRRDVLASRFGSLDDGGARHVLSCWRRGATLGVTVDGVSSTITFNLGTVSPTGSPTIGNKSSTGGASDQLFGRVWSLKVAYGTDALPNSLP